MNFYDKLYDIFSYKKPTFKREEGGEIRKSLKIITIITQVATVIQQPGFKRVKRGYKPLSVDNLVPLYEIQNPLNPASKDPTDPFFPYQWYLKNVGQNGGKPKLDLNVEAAWAQGVTGKNVTTAIMDDGA